MKLTRTVPLTAAALLCLLLTGCGSSSTQAVGATDGDGGQSNASDPGVALSTREIDALNVVYHVGYNGSPAIPYTENGCDAFVTVFEAVEVPGHPMNANGIDGSLQPGGPFRATLGNNLENYGYSDEIDPIVSDAVTCAPYVARKLAAAG